MDRIALRLAALTRFVTSTRQVLVFAGLFIAAAGYVIWLSLAASSAKTLMARESRPVTAWSACNRNAGATRPSTFTPLSDARAASLVTAQREDRRYNAKPYTVAGRRFAAANSYIPSSAELGAFRRSNTSLGQGIVQFNPYFRYVDGRDGLRSPSTDDLIQWVAHKWGIPEDWLRAEFVQESYWNQFQLGDEAAVSPRWYLLYPPQARVPGTHRVYQSLGITQAKWIPDGSVGAGSEPLRWKSTAFNLDYQGATVRFYYDDPEGARSSWGDASYQPCQRWNSIGGWFEPSPWGNGAQEDYVRKVRRRLLDRTWTGSTFVRWTPASFPPGISFR